MRYGTQTCEYYCKNNPACNPNDEIYVHAEEMVNVEKQLEEIRQQRYKFVSFDKSLNPVVVDQISFDKNIEEEAKVLNQLQQSINLFNILNPKFKEIEKEVPRLTAPNIEGLKSLKNNLKTLNNDYRTRMKAKAAEMLTTRTFSSGNLTLTEIIESDSYKKFCEPLNLQTAKNEEDIEKINVWIGEIEEALISIYGE